jgi:hypothetical protein
MSENVLRDKLVPGGDEIASIYKMKVATEKLMISTKIWEKRLNSV